MKKNIHPTMYPTVFIDAATGDKIFSASTVATGETMDIDGTSYQVVHCDITSRSHPYFTGEMRFVDERGQVDRFKQKIKLAEEKQQALAKKASGKKKSETSAEAAKSYRDLLREQQEVLRSAKTTQA